MFGSILRQRMAKLAQARSQPVAAAPAVAPKLAPPPPASPLPPVGEDPMVQKQPLPAAPPMVAPRGPVPANPRAILRARRPFRFRGF